jgi:hypothetical protein
VPLLPLPLALELATDNLLGNQQSDSNTVLPGYLAPFASVYRLVPKFLMLDAPTLD